MEHVLGGGGGDIGHDIAINGGDIYVTGKSSTTWGSPKDPFTASTGDAFVAGLVDGKIDWNTFLGGDGDDACTGIALSASGNIYVPGFSTATWGTPLNSFNGGSTDAFVAKLNSNDHKIDWNTFLGGTGDDIGNAMAIDSKGYLYIIGSSSDTWGTPVNPHEDCYDAFVTLIENDDPTPPYEINLDKINLSFGVIWPIQTNYQIFTVSSKSSNPNDVPIWWITCDKAWFSCNPTTGTGPGLVTVSVNPAGLEAGTYSGLITATDPNAGNSPQTINVTLTVYSPGQTKPPFGHFSTPVDGTAVSGNVPFTGWALDDIGIENVKLYRGEVGDLIYIGDAIFVEGARPDVEQSYPGYPMNYKAGWGYMMLTNFLPDGGNGEYKIHAIATDAEGNQITLGVKTITCDNAHAVKPFGAIDTPAQGGNVSGKSFVNWGWVLTPQPDKIPEDGSTINIWVDGKNICHPTYNIYRGDISALFPGYTNSNGAIGYFYLDTTPYENGIHTIYWTAADSEGDADGIGSRYFSIANTGQASAQSQYRQNRQHQNDLIGFSSSSIEDIPINNSESLRIRKGFDETIHDIAADEQGIYTIAIQELDPVEIDISGGNPILTGYMRVGNQPRALPIGSSLDTNAGKFYWTPGPGFVGNYHFVFIERGCDNYPARKEIIVDIRPKVSKPLDF
ncbi:MAG: Ig-like domain-containing protein [Candidatus Aminicenantes bacterium]|nr:Ig-like domain-containing protein [Candidatus Aminicenantes bacterium]